MNKHPVKPIYLQRKTDVKIITKICVVLIYFTLGCPKLQSQQAEYYSVDLDNMTLVEIFNHLESQFRYSFIYTSDVINHTKKYSIQCNHCSIHAVLHVIQGKSGINYKIHNQNITVKTPDKYTISGLIRDKKSGEYIVHANIYDAASLDGTVSNNYGFFSLTLPEGKRNIVYSFVGYKVDTLNLNVQSDQFVEIELNPSISIQEVVITESKRNQNIESTLMGLVRLPIIQTKQLPVLLGEADVFKTVQLMPGVQSGSEGSSGLFVRGGSPDQNLILIDGVPVYNANHLFGFFSVFNPDAIKNVSLIKGGFPARYGGRLSSVLDIKMKEGNMKEFRGDGSIGLVASQLTLEGPIQKDKTSFLVSGRRTYIDVISWPVQQIMNKLDSVKMDQLAGYFFYDFNAKINHRFSDKSRIYLSTYTGKDKFYYEASKNEKMEVYTINKTDNANLDWGNLITAFRWNYILNPNLFSNTTITYSQYSFNVFNENIEKTNNENISDKYHNLNYFSDIKDVSGKIDFDWVPNNNHYIRFGISYTRHKFHPGVFSEKYEQNVFETPIDTAFGNVNITGNEAFLYMEDDVNLSKRLKSNAGIHVSSFFVDRKLYKSAEPRISLRYLISDNLAIKASYASMTQYIHLLTNSGIGLPTDLWVPSTSQIMPQKSKQIALGASLNLQNQVSISVEGYYKKMQNLVEYKEGASFFDVYNDWQEKIEQGKGWSYGTEFFIEKTTGKTTGWLGYTLAWSNRQFQNISFGETFPFKYDRRHDISIAITHKHSEKFDIGISWVYGTGTATTLPEQKYISQLSLLKMNLDDGNYSLDPSVDLVEYINKRNSYRMPAYHRLDAGFNFHKNKKWGKRTWSVGAYNAYNRLNAYYLYLQKAWDPENGSYKIIKKFSLFPVIPYFRYSFSF